MNLSNIRPDVKSTLDQLIVGDTDPYNFVHKLRYARTLEIILDSYEEGKILELGTSSVIPISLELLGIEAEVAVTDFDLSRSESGIYTCKVAGLSRKTKRYSVDLESTPIPAKDETYTLVLCCEVLEHMDVDPMFMLAEVNRVLELGGKLILTTPNITNTRAIWKILRGIEPYFYMQYHRDRSPYRHNYEHSVETVEVLLAAAGFSYNIWTEDTFEEPVLEDITFLESAGFKLKKERLGDNIFAVATKVSDVVDRHPGRIYV